ncbi:RNA polymerase sigma factor rpoD [Striga asiatica]|uniref:RNA polymerase sigma factor rpoD n=1 Tax=Striga asiatica TaxID=4170 RepID=A0A5A7QM15_STRAF|nr:RNA polymerase sigma factor rpoD [Striga asiatica]
MKTLYLYVYTVYSVYVSGFPPTLWENEYWATAACRYFSLASESIFSNSKNSTGVGADRAAALAREAFSACKEVASVAKYAELFAAHRDESFSKSLKAWVLRGLAGVPFQRTVRSTRLLERQSKKRVPKPKFELHETNYQKNSELHQSRKLYGGFDQKDPVTRFLSRPGARQLLTAQEESKLVEKIQELMQLNEVKSKLQTRFSREPTLLEWAEAVGISCHALLSRVQRGYISRDRLIFANFRLVVHIAKKYQGHGLSLQDLLQVGSMGLMRSLTKFKPHLGCRFNTYAYYWIKQSIMKSLYKDSRIIRLPGNVYGLLFKVNAAKKEIMRQGNFYPENEDLAALVGIPVDRLETILFYATRVPLSIERALWINKRITYQCLHVFRHFFQREISEYLLSNENPQVDLAKQMMRQHVRSLLSVLSSRERKIIEMRFGMEDGIQYNLAEIGDDFGVSRERIRQLEKRAMLKLKERFNSEELQAYAGILV